MDKIWTQNVSSQQRWWLEMLFLSVQHGHTCIPAYSTSLYIMFNSDIKDQSDSLVSVTISL